MSIIIPAFNEQQFIGACLAAALNQSVRAAEIIVVDNGSTDGTAATVRGVQRRNPGRGIVLIRQDAEPGLVPTRNAGFDAASGDILGRIDADSVLQPDWVRQVGRAFADGRAAAVTGPVVYYDMPLHRFGLRLDDGMRRLMLRLAGRRYHFLFGSNMAITRGAWERIRADVCRDEADEMHEDIDLSLHLAAAGLPVAYEPSVVCGMSTRRLLDPPAAFGRYVTRFARTYKSHRVGHVGLRAPMVVFLAIYFPAKALRAVYAALSPAGRAP